MRTFSQDDLLDIHNDGSTHHSVRSPCMMSKNTLVSSTASLLRNYCGNVIYIQSGHGDPARSAFFSLLVVLSRALNGAYRLRTNYRKKNFKRSSSHLQRIRQTSGT